MTECLRIRTAILLLAPLLGLSTMSEAAAEWSDIKVEVQADRRVSVAHRLTAEADGFRRLLIALSNEGEQALTIGKIRVRIPLPGHLSTETEMLYGGSCMGQTPLLRQKIGGRNARSTNHMYEMVRLAGGDFTIEDGAFVVGSDGGGKQLKPGETIQYEQIVLRRAGDWVDLLSQFGIAIAKENGIAKLKKADFKGWATWDYYTYLFSADDIYGNIEKLGELGPASNLLQIDAGWYAARGDYAKARPDLPGGMMGIADRIRKAGMTPGILLDGFRANSTSEVCKKHPEYFLHDQDGNMIIEVRRNEGPDIYLGVFNWSDKLKEYSLPAFRKSEAVKLEGRHSVILKYDGKDTFARLCQKLQSR